MKFYICNQWIYYNRNEKTFYRFLINTLESAQCFLVSLFGMAAKWAIPLAVFIWFWDARSPIRSQRHIKLGFESRDWAIVLRFPFDSPPESSSRCLYQGGVRLKFLFKEISSHILSIQIVAKCYSINSFPTLLQKWRWCVDYSTTPTLFLRFIV